MKEKYVVYEINEEELKEAVGGKDDILPYRPSMLCPSCFKNLPSVNGFIVRNSKGTIFEFRYKEPFCESCAQKDLDAYVLFGWEFISWI